MNIHDQRRRLLHAATLLAGSSSLLFGAAGGGHNSEETYSELGQHDYLLPPAPSPLPPSPSPARAAPEPQPGQLLDLPDLPIVVQSVVETLGHSTEGEIVQTLGPAWQAILNAIAADPNALERLSPRQLEELIAASYDKAGFDEVILTPRSGDLGRDVIAVKRGFFSVRIIDQVKHFSPGHRVAANDVRALVGVLLSDERATKGFVTTTSRFAPGIATDPFIAKHVPYRLELIDGPSLISRLLSLGSAQRTGA